MVVLQSAAIKLYINNSLYKEVQQISYVIDYGESSIYGIDSPHPQEITSTRTSVRGSISGIRLKYSGGIQAYNARPLITDILSSPYVSIRIQDRASGEDLIFIPQAKVNRQTTQIPLKGVVKVSFDFEGIIPFEPLDRS